MGSFRENEESLFFDALEDIRLESDIFSDLKDWDYDVWISTPLSVIERRQKFMPLMEFCLNELEGSYRTDSCGDNDKGSLRDDCHRITVEGGSSSTCSSSGSNSDDFEPNRGMVLSESRTVNGNLSVNGVLEDRRQGSCQLGEIENASEFPSPVQIRIQSESDANGHTPRTLNRLRDRWLSRIRSMTCMMRRHVEDDSLESNRLYQDQGAGIHRVRVRHHRTRSKELSALFAGQEIQAHEGSILSMKFSPDGQYLASAGEDKFVKVWQVVEDERSAMGFAAADPSCLYFSVNQLAELKPVMVEKDYIGKKSKSLQNTPNSACVVLPTKIFQIVDTPLHVFHGHSGEILDLSWSKNNCLLSSSTDNTVRLWRIGVQHCLKVFRHSDYVTCIQFNPVNDDYFISGSLDGMMRIWEINSCKVVDWTETKEIITAVSYSLDGQGGIFGSIAGNCQPFNITDNRLRLKTRICLASQKKKSSCKRITGFQFLAQDPNLVLVTCADSHVRIINGVDVIAKYKGVRNTGNHISASFTSDGKHIISASDDSNVYIWNYVSSENHYFSAPKTVRSFECFSSDASVAIPWPGLNTVNAEDRVKLRKLLDKSINCLPFCQSTRFSLSQDFFLDSGSKGSATWPEEKLGAMNPRSSMSKFHYKLFKASCQSLSNSDAWGLVIVTAGWDGRIRSFLNYSLPSPL